MKALDRLRQVLSNMETAIATLVHHPEPSVNSQGQTIGLHMRDAKIAMDDIANELNIVEADSHDAAYAATATKPLTPGDEVPYVTNPRGRDPSGRYVADTH